MMISYYGDVIHGDVIHQKCRQVYIYACRIVGKFDGGLNLMNLWLTMLVSH